MSFLAPITGLIAAGIAIPSLVLLYFLKLRRRKVAISSTLLWKRAVHDMQVNAPFQKLRRNLLLLLQLILLILILIAIARPTTWGTQTAGQRMIVLIDNSGSMNATDGEPTRLDEAKTRALERVEAFDGAGGIMVMSFARDVRIVQGFTTNKAELRSAINSIEPTDQPSYIGPPLQLIEPRARESAAGGADALSVFIFSDGTFHDDALKVALEGAEVQYHRVGKTEEERLANNVGVVAMSARRDFEKPTYVEMYAELANYSQEPVQTNVSVTIEGRVSTAVGVTIPGAKRAGAEPGRVGVPFRVQLDAGAMVGVRHDFEDDLLSDNEAYLSLPAPRALHVLLVTQGNAFLQNLLQSLGVKKLVVKDPTWYEDQGEDNLTRTSEYDEEGYDVIIFDGYSPKALPPVDSLYFSAAPPVEKLKLLPSSKPEGNVQVLIDWRRDDPVLRHVSLEDMVVQNPARLAVPDDATILATGVEGPVMARLTAGGSRHVVVSFDVIKSNWPWNVSFVVFLKNSIDVLALGGAGSHGVSYEPGRVVTVTQLQESAKQVTYQGPRTLTATAENGRAILPPLKRVGIYQATSTVPAHYQRLAVNMTDPRESDTRARDTIQIGSTKTTFDASAVEVRKEIWWWFLLAAVGMLVLEWLVYTLRMGL